MKKKLLVTVAAAGLMIAGMTSNVYAQVAKGTVAVDAYYGFPNLLTQAVKSVYNDQNAEGYKVSGFGPAGVRGEYFVTDHIAFGADVNYSQTNIQWREISEEYDPITNTNFSRAYNYKVSVPRLRILGKFNFHFGASEHFDWYAGAGIGYNNTKVTLTTNDPSYDGYEELGGIFVIPISGRINFGGRYFFTENIGLGFEVGLGGGPLASLGICAKF
jgi:opacity protein-like surface antigen